jgi:hypothetical protein
MSQNEKLVKPLPRRQLESHIVISGNPLPILPTRDML